MFFDSMGILESSLGYVNKDTEIQEIIESAPIIECYDEPVEAVMRFVYENEMNYNNICNAINMQQLAFMQENAGQMMVYEAGEIKNIIDKFIDWLQQMIGKIKGHVQKVFTWIDKQCDYNKQWIKANEDKLAKVSGAKINVRGYEYPIGRVKNKAIYDVFKIGSGSFTGVYKNVLDQCNPIAIKGSKTTKESLESIKKEYTNKDKKEAAQRDLMKAVTGKNSTAKTFGDDLKKYFQGEEKDYTAVPDTCVKELKDGKDTKYAMKEAYEAMAKNLAEAIKDAKKYKKELDVKVDNRHLLLDCANYYIDVVKTASNLSHRVYQAQTRAIMARLSLFRKLAGAAISKGRDNTKKIDEGFNFLDLVELI